MTPSTSWPRSESASAAATPRAEIERWQALGVAVLPGPRGKKGPRIDDWTVLPHEACWELAHAASVRPTNLVVRTGQTADGSRCLGAIDLDGKCPCGHDRGDHPEDHACQFVKAGAECDCCRYRGVPPADALASLLEILPATVAIARTNRGFHIIFWVVAACPNGALPAYSAEVFGGDVPHALQVAPSLHPAGIEYRWIREPGPDLAMVDLHVLGLVVADAPSEAHPRRRSGSTSVGDADPEVVARFRALMAEVGIVEGAGPRRDRGGEFFVCPSHGDREASLHVLWSGAVFWCLGGEQGGGLRKLIELVAPAFRTPSRMFPKIESALLPERGTNGGSNELVEHIASLVDGLPLGACNVNGQQLRACRQFVLTYECAAGWAGHQFAPRDQLGSPTPMSCDATAGICARCGPARFLADARASSLTRASC